jgi:hypothetical protein
MWTPINEKNMEHAHWALETSRYSNMQSAWCVSDVCGRLLKVAAKILATPCCNHLSHVSVQVMQSSIVKCIECSCFQFPGLFTSSTRQDVCWRQYALRCCCSSLVQTSSGQPNLRLSHSERWITTEPHLQHLSLIRLQNFCQSCEKISQHCAYFFNFFSV